MSSSALASMFQNAVYAGINLGNVLYGIELALYFRTMQVLLSRRAAHRKFDTFHAIFSSVMLLMITIRVSTQGVVGEKMWIMDADYPGGPDAYWAANESVWYTNLGMTASTALQLMTDALMIYRCQLICDNRHVIIMPVLLWLGTLVLGILVIWSSSSPGGNFFSGTAAKFGLAYYSITVGLTALLTAMICYRMVTHGRMVKKRLGQDYASVYFTLFAVMVESVLPYTLSGIAFLVTFGTGSEMSIGFGCVYIMMMCISPQMLILRVATGLGWNEETGKVILTSVVPAWPESPEP